MTLKKGDTVRVHPAHDLFMRGVTYATVTSIGRKWVHLHHYRTNTNHKVSRRIAAEYLSVDEVGPAISSKRFGNEPYEHETD